MATVAVDPRTEYLLRLGDDALVLGQRLSEWCGHGPVLEVDISLANLALDMVLRVPGGFFKCGDPWHSMTNEVEFVHNPGWKVAVPSNAEDAVGLLRGSLRGNDPVLFFEHRAMLDDSWARRPCS